MSTTGSPSQDLCVSSLVVSNSVSSLTSSTLSLTTDTINGIPEFPILTQIRRISDGASIGQWMLQGNVETIILNGMINQTGGEVKANTVVNYIENYLPTRFPRTFNVLIWIPVAPTIEQALITATMTISEKGDISYDVDLQNCEVGLDYRRKGLATEWIKRRKGL